MAKVHYIHVNQNVLRGNQKHGRSEPAITVKSGSKNQYGYAAVTNGVVTITYGGNGDPLIRCGARVAIVSDQAPVVLPEPQTITRSKYRIRIDGPRIQANKRNNEMDPVVKIMDDNGQIVECYGARIEGEIRVVQSVEEGGQCIAILVDGIVVPVYEKPVIACKKEGAC